MASSKAVLLVFTTAIATVVAGFLINGTTVPFLNEINYTTPTDVSFYVLVNALQVLARIPISVLLGLISSEIGSVRTLRYSFLVAIVGILLLLFSRVSSFLFVTAYLLSSILLSVRVLRIGILSDLIAPDYRTTFMALHQLMNPVANFLGPSCWILIQRWTGSVSFMSDTLVLDRFSLSQLSAVAIMVFATIITSSLLSEVERTSDQESNSSNSSRYLQESEPLRQEASTGGPFHSATTYATLPIDTLTFEGAPKFSFYLAVSMLGRISTSIAAVSFQPILVDIFMVSDAGLGRVYLVTASLAFSFPLISAVLSRYLRDKELLLIGLLVKLTGNLLYLPLFGRVGLWQLVVAYVLTFRTAMFQTAALSSYTKTVRDRPTRKRGIANLNAGSNGVGALVRFLVARWILPIFNGWWYSIFAVPTCLALVLVFIHWDSLSAHEYSESFRFEEKTRSSEQLRGTEQI